MAGEPIELTAREFDLLAHLASRPGVVFSREQLLSEVWRYADSAGVRTVDSHVAGLRRKLGRRGRPHRAWRRLRARGGAAQVNPLGRIRSIKVKLGIVIVAGDARRRSSPWSSPARRASYLRWGVVASRSCSRSS